MPRPLSFDPTAALDKAMHLFWVQGYRATSVQDLVAATGLNRSSLYNSFGDKRELFDAALHHYVTRYSAERLALLQQDRTTGEALRAYFEELVGFSSGAGKGLGCLLTNTAVEIAPHDGGVARALNARFAETGAAFKALLSRGQASGDIPADKDPQVLAHFFLGTVQGLRVLARAGAEEAMLRDIVNTALQVLD